MGPESFTFKSTDNALLMHCHNQYSNVRNEYLDNGYKNITHNLKNI